MAMLLISMNKIKRCPPFSLLRTLFSSLLAGLCGRTTATRRTRQVYHLNSKEKWNLWSRASKSFKLMKKKEFKSTMKVFTLPTTINDLNGKKMRGRATYCRGEEDDFNATAIRRFGSSMCWKRQMNERLESRWLNFVFSSASSMSDGWLRNKTDSVYHLELNSKTVTVNLDEWASVVVLS